MRAYELNLAKYLQTLLEQINREIEIRNIQMQKIGLEVMKQPTWTNQLPPIG